MGKINLQSAQTIINEYINGASSYYLAEKYQLQQTSICNLVAGRTWPECVRPCNIQEIIYERRKKGLDLGIRKHKILPALDALQKSVLTGSLLGDGYLSKVVKNGNSRFTKKQSIGKKDYIIWHKKIFSDYSCSIKDTLSCTELAINPSGTIKHIAVPTEKRQIKGCVFSTINHPEFTFFRNKWYDNNNKKIIPKDILLDETSLSVWFADDGYNSFSQRYAVFCTQSFTFEEVDILRSKIKDFSINSDIKTRKSSYDNRDMPVLKISKSNYDSFINLIKPYFKWESLMHKIEHRDALKQYEISSNLSEEDVHFIHECRITKSKTFKELGKMFNMHPNSIQNIVYGINWRHIYNLYYKK